MATRPFTTFNFQISLQLEGENTPICQGEFSDCDGIEMSLAPKTIREGGNNGRQFHLIGPVSYGQLSLKRGMTDNFGLWTWFERIQQARNLPASGEIMMLNSDRNREDVRFVLSGCLPVKLKATALNAKDGQIAIEELQIAYETLHLAIQEA